MADIPERYHNDDLCEYVHYTIVKDDHADDEACDDPGCERDHVILHDDGELEALLADAFHRGWTAARTQHEKLGAGGYTHNHRRLEPPIEQLPIPATAVAVPAGAKPRKKQTK